MKTKTIRIKKKGGGTRSQKVQVLASGKYKFIKNSTKSARKPVAKKRKSAPKRTKSAKVKRTQKRSYNMGRRKGSKRKSSPRRNFGSSVKGVFNRSGILGKAAAGIGAGVIAGIAVDKVAPQYSEIVKPVAGFLAGGPIGAIAPLVLAGGLSGIGGIFGSNKVEAGGL